MRILILLTIFLSSYSLKLSGQSSQLIDSLYLKLESQADDNTKVDILIKLSAAKQQTDIEEAIRLAKDALKLSNYIDNDTLIIKSYYYIAGGFDYTNSNNDSTLFYIKKAEYLSENNPDNYYLGDICNKIGGAYRKKGNYKKAIEYGFKSIRISEKTNNKKSMAYAYNNIAYIYWDKGDFYNVKKYLLKTLDYLLEVNDSLNLCNIYANLYSVMEGEEQLNYILKAEKIALKNNYDHILARLYVNFGYYYFDHSYDLQKSKKYHLKALGYANKVNDVYAKGSIWNSLGIICNTEGKIDSCIYYTKKSLEANIATNSRKEIKKGYYTLYEAFKLLPDKDSAIYYLEKSMVIQDSINNDNILVEIENANAKYETEKKDAEITKQELEILKQKSNRNKILGAGAFLFLLFAAIFFRYFERQKRKKKEAEITLSQKYREAQKYKELDVMKNQFFTNITHELRTPLTLIMGPLGNALEKTDEPSIKKDLHLAQNNTHRLLDMINEILDLSKLESGKVSINQDEIAVNTFFRRVLFSFQSAAEMQNIKLDYLSEDDDKAAIIVDIEKLEIILNNLIANALKFSPSDEVIQMNISRKDKNLVIKIQDHGAGIPIDEQEHIFNRFYQASNTSTKTQGGGTGVGLALSKSLITLMGGNISVESEIGKGSIFTLVLPTTFSIIDDKKQITNANPKKEKAYEPILFNGEKPHILVIEDNPEMQEFLIDILKDEYKVTVANDGAHGLQLLQTKSYDLVSCDVMMPKMDGFTLKEKSNHLELQKDIPFVFLTAKVLEEDKLKGLRLGVDDYISKPFNKNEYKARIHNLLSNRKERLEYLSLNTDFALQNTDSVEYQILKKAEILVNKNVANPNLKVSELASELNYSQRQLARVIKKLTGFTPVQFILELRLQRANQLIQSGTFSTAQEVQYEVGIESSSYFNRKYRERFGVAPRKNNKTV